MTDAAISNSDPACMLKQRVQLLSQLALAHKVITGESSETTEEQATKLGFGLFTLVVMGEIKKGKSSLINAILGTEGLLPVADEVATSAVFKIHYGPELKFKVFFLPEANRSKQEIHAAELAAYGSEIHNPGNQKKVEFISVEVPAPILREGMVIIDTPGLGGLCRTHRDITLRYAPRADAILFVTDSYESPIGREEIDFLRNLRCYSEQIAFVQTKTDLAGDEQSKRFMEANLATLRRELGMPDKELRYFCVSSRSKAKADKNKDLGKLRDSGIPALIHYLEAECYPRQQRRLADEADQQIIPLATRLQHELRQRRRSQEQAAAEAERQLQLQRIQLDSEKERRRGEISGDQQAKASSARLQQELEERRRQLVATSQAEADALRVSLEKEQFAANKLANQDLPRLQKEISASLENIQEDLINGTSSLLRPNGPLIAEIQESLDFCSSATELYALVPKLAEHLRDRAAALTHQRCREAVRQAEDAVASLSSSIKLDSSQQIDHRQLGADQERLLAIITAKQHGTKHLSHLKTVAMGGMMGGTLASIAGGLIGSVIPVIGTVVGSAAGLAIAGAFFAKDAYETQTQGEQEKARGEVLNACNNLLQAISGELSSGLRKLFRQIRDQTQEALQAEGQRLAKQTSERRLDAENKRQELAKKQEELRKVTKTRLDDLDRDFKNRYDSQAIASRDEEKRRLAELDRDFATLTAKLDPSPLEQAKIHLATIAEQEKMLASLLSRVAGN